MTYLDAHCHFWRLSRGDYHWLINGGDALKAIQKDFLPDDIPTDSDLIAVQAAPSIDETRFLLSLALNEARIKAVVGWVDLADPGASELLRSLSVNPKLVGVRPMLQDIDNNRWLLEDTDPNNFLTLMELGLRFDALVTSRHLSTLYQFASLYKNLPIIIDHCAKPNPESLASWKSGMRMLGGLPNVYCKFSGVLTEFSAQQLSNPMPHLEELFQSLIEWFGTKRIVWGSDWPVLTLVDSWEHWFSLTQRLLDNVSSADAEAILFHNAKTFYGLDDD